MRNSNTWFVLGVICSFIAPIFYWRTKHYFLPWSFVRLSRIRLTTRLNVHHGHWGLLLVVLAGSWNSLLANSPWITLIFFFGLGLLCDEIIPSLLVPSTSRYAELSYYSASLRPTLILAGIVVFIILAVFLGKVML